MEMPQHVDHRLLDDGMVVFRPFVIFALDVGIIIPIVKIYIFDPFYRDARAM